MLFLLVHIPQIYPRLALNSFDYSPLCDPDAKVRTKYFKHIYKKLAFLPIRDMKQLSDFLLNIK